MLQQEKSSENKDKLQMNSTTFWQDPTHTAACNAMDGEITSFTSLGVDQGCYMAVLFSHSIGFCDRVNCVKQRCHEGLIYEKSQCILQIATFVIT